MSEMFNPDLFVSQFWEWYVIIIVLGSIAACFFLIIWMGEPPRPKDEEVKTMGHVWDGNLEEYNNPLPGWWLKMFYITLYFGIIYLILYPGLGSYKGILGWSEIKQYEQEMDAAEARFGPIYNQYKDVPVEELAKNEDAVLIGQRLFMTYCTSCHGSDAGGVKGYPNLRDDDWLWGGEPATIHQTIANGRQANMPNAVTNGLVDANGEADETKVQNVTQYVLSLSDREHDAAKAAEGKKVFDTVCMACHTPAGTGMTALGAPNLTDNVWLYGGHPKAIEETIRSGRQGIMPAHGEFLGEAKVHLLTTYVYSLSNKEEAAAE